MDVELTKLQEHERHAMCLDRTSISEVIDGLRRYREAVRKVLAHRYSDGECDSSALSTLESDASEIEDAENDR